MPERVSRSSRVACVRTPARRSRWVHELKHDDHRIIAYVRTGGRVRLTSRRGNDATRRFAPVARWLWELKVESTIIDGEIAVPDQLGVTHIDLLNFAARHMRPSA
jgi:bifunctional non-homologous end joining protein LigD